MVKNKSLLKNSIANICYKLLNIIFPLITVTYISRILLADGVGKVSYAQNIVSYFTMFAILGMPSYGTREIAKLKNNDKEKNKTFSELFMINLISTLLFSILYIIVINSFEIFYSRIWIYYSVGLTLFLNIFNIDWFYQGEEEYSYIALRSFFIKIISVICIFTFVKSRNDVLQYAVIVSLGTVGNYILNVLNLRNKVKFSLKDIQMTRHLKSLLILTASSVAIELYTAMDITMIGIMCTDKEVGYYSNALKIINISQSVISAMGAVLLPRLSLYHAEGKQEKFDSLVNKSLKYLMILAIPSAIGLFFTANLIIQVLFGPSFLNAINTLRILSLTLPILVINVLFGIQCLIPMGMEKKYLVTVCLGAIVNLILNPVLILYFKNEGAAIASLISESIVALSTIYFVKKKINITIEKEYVISLTISSIIMILCIKIIDFLTFNNTIKLVALIVIAALIYIICLLIMKNKYVIEIIDKITKIFRKKEKLR